MSDPKTDFDAAYPEKLRLGERDLLRKRRGKADLKKEEDPLDAGRLVGVGLSGGGIRSATFALGIFQGLAAKRGLLREVDFLSTVSGGGYFGSFFGRLLTRKDYVPTWKDVEDVLLGRKEPRVLGFLRENGRYLSPNGAGDSLLSGAALLRNWVSIQVVLALFVLALFLGLQTLRVGVELILGLSGRYLPPEAGADALIWWSPLIWLPVVSFVLAAFPLGWAYWLVEPEREAISEGAGKDGKRSPITPVAALALVFVLSLVLTFATRKQPEIAAVWGLIVVVALLVFGFWRWARWNLPDQRPMETAPGEKEMERYEKMDQALYRNNALRNRLSLWLTAALVITGLLLVLAFVDSLGQSLYAVLSGNVPLGAWLAALFSSIGVLTGFGRSIAMFFSKGSGKDRPSIPVKLIATVAALLLGLLLLVTIDAGSHAIAWGGGKPAGAPPRLLEPDKEEKVFDIQVRGSAPLGMDLRVRDAGKKRVPIVQDAKEKREGRDPSYAFLGFASALLLSLLFGQTWPFVNRSSHLSLYASRLTRAYLGASNLKRLDGQNLTQPLEGDDIALASYWPPPLDNAAPIHLINVTINETIDGQSQVQQQDRKGTGLALGPWGMSAGVRHHAVMPLGDEELMLDPEGEPVFEIYPLKGYRVFDYPKLEKSGQVSSLQTGGAVLEPSARPSWLAKLRAPRRGAASTSAVQPARKPSTFTGEALALGDWLSISGAAFSTGTGFRTSLGLSFLAGFANVRLGRWWDSGIVRKKDGSGKWLAKRKITLRIEDAFARLFPVQTYLLDEFLARFPGTARRHWYLSDGGHFENMGGYELLRRRLRFILIVDGEMDADSTYEGLANLVRKARLDFGAEVHFLTEEQLDEVLSDDVRPYIGTLEQLKRGEWKDTLEDESKPHGRLEKPGRDGFSLAHAALAQITYDSGADVSWLLYVKPTLTGREPVDVLEYHTGHPAFPHEPTIDQFFDEAQWESYRRLGKYIGDVLFGKLDRLLPEDDKKPEGSLLKDWNWKPGWIPEDPEAAQAAPAPKGLEALKAKAKKRRVPRYS